MTAMAARRDSPAQAGADGFEWEAMRLSGFLAATADRHGERVALKDQPGRERWCGRPSFTWTYRLALDVVGRLVAVLARLGLPPGSPVGICLPNGTEACLTILAVEQAGFVPCLMPLGWSEDQLAAALEAASMQAVITQNRVSGDRPAEAFCRLAARYFGLRFILSFGPQVPDGVIDLDRAVLAGGAAAAGEEAAPGGATDLGIVTFSARGPRLVPVFRPARSVVAAAVSYLVASRVGPGERILSLLPPDDHRGLTTGLMAALLSGATLECHGLFDGASLVASLGEEMPTHLVVPAFMEPYLSNARLPESLASVILVHQAPARFKARSSLRSAVVDVLSCDELALVAAPRDGRGQFALSLDGEGDRQPGRGLVRVRREEDGTIALGGKGAEVYRYERGAPVMSEPPEWVACGLRAEVFAGIVIGVSEQRG
jgi:non-ribosomal peptide synthetase component F